MHSNMYCFISSELKNNVGQLNKAEYTNRVDWKEWTFQIFYFPLSDNKRCYIETFCIGIAIRAILKKLKFISARPVNFRLPRDVT